MELRVSRDIKSPNFTLGKFFIDGAQHYFTCEDAIRSGPKVYGQTAIPAGTYKVIINQSQRFGRAMPLLMNVPGFDGIRIHWGNTAVDTDGCILIGLARNADGVGGSKMAFNDFFERLTAGLEKGDVWLEIA